MKRLFAIFAHPDDEGAIAGTLAHYSQSGVHVALACTTRGESGEISDPALATSENLGSVREEELRCAGQIIGVSELHFLGYCDSGMKGSTDNARPTAFIQADPDEVRYKLVKLIRRIKPHIVITFEPHGWYGHPDHIVAGRLATEAFHLAYNAGAFPSAGDLWQPQRLYHALLDLNQFGVIFDYARRQGLDTSDFDALREEIARIELPPVSHKLDVDEYYEIREKATRCHRTQYGQDNLLLQVPAHIRRTAGRHEIFSQIYPVIKSHLPQSDDLFAGIDPILLR
jgi:LmbE family N-acetylglucosaminyl deacetylase